MGILSKKEMHQKMPGKFENITHSWKLMNESHTVASKSPSTEPGYP